MSYFGDTRIDDRFDWLMDRVVSTGSVVLRRLGDGRAGELAAHRFLDNERVTCDGIVETSAQRTAAACQGRRIVAVQDTTEINFSGRDKSRTGLGAGGNGVARGFFIHPVIAVDRDDDAVIGLVDAQIWTRGSADLEPRRTRPFEDKESHRWLEGAKRSAACLEGAAQIVMVADREADIYPVFARRPAGVDLVIRSAHDRSLAGGARLKEATQALPDYGVMAVAVRAKPGQKARTAHVTLRAGRISVCRPLHGVDTQDPDTLTLNVVESRELDPPKGCQPLHWCVYTTLSVDTQEEVREVIEIYKQRWRIEEVFRVLKTNGLKLEETQVQAAHRLFNLAALAMVAATRIMQLVDARQASSRPASDVIDTELFEAVAIIGKTLEGKTERQKNHHKQGTLPWLSWIVARLGGWNCYYKPPGPKTMATGWTQLTARIEGFLIAKETQNV